MPQLKQPSQGLPITGILRNFSLICQNDGAVEVLTDLNSEVATMVVFNYLVPAMSLNVSPNPPLQKNPN